MERNLLVIGRDDSCLPDRQPASILIPNRLLQTPLNPPKIMAVQQIEAAVHKAKAVGGTDGVVAFQVEQRAVMHLNEVEFAAKPPSSVDVR